MIGLALLSLITACILSAFFQPMALQAQNSRDFAVLLRAQTATQPTPSITLSWNSDPYAESYNIERKHKAETTWTYIGETGADATSFTDKTVELSIGYEYAVRKLCKQPITDDSTLTYQGSGYIYAGIDVLPPDTRGTVLLLVDNTMSAPLALELQQLEADMKAEGWNVLRADVERTEEFSSSAVQEIKTLITDVHTSTPGGLQSVFLYGRIAVPYSGRIAPDGHPDHLGAWPADAYYADVDGVWTDKTVSDDTTELGRAATRNIAGDGKFDQSSLPSIVELQIGRVDFYDMDNFALSETELLRRYLNKNHRYRTGQIAVQEGGIIDDNFPASSMAEAFASSGWRNIALFGNENSVRAADLFTTLDTASYLWAYGCGPGSYTSCQEAASTPQFATTPVNAVFTMLFGSYFGDWDSPNNLLRAAIASEPSVLTCVWAARPHWYFHHLLLGEPIGYSTLISQNNYTTYIPNYNYNVPGYPNGVIYSTGNKQPHAALMGDPTLRVYRAPVPPPPMAIMATQPLSTQVQLRWTPPAQPVAGYQVYRAVSPEGPFTLVTSGMITQPEFIDNVPAGTRDYTYKVRSLVRNESNGGTYLEAGAAALQTVTVSVPDNQQHNSESLICFPNPAVQSAVLAFSQEQTAPVHIDIFSATGARVINVVAAHYSAGSHTVEWNLTDAAGNRVAPGLYTVRCHIGNTVRTAHIVVHP